jgi:hypothetical protein
MVRFLRTREAAAYLGLAPHTLARWRTEGSPIPFSRLGRAVVYRIDDLEAFALAGKRYSTAADSRLAPALHNDG